MLGSCPLSEGARVGLAHVGCGGFLAREEIRRLAKYRRAGKVSVQTAVSEYPLGDTSRSYGWIANHEPKNEKVRLITQPYVLSDKGVRVKRDTPATNNPGVPIR